jgi:hypothetical protein
MRSSWPGKKIFDPNTLAYRAKCIMPCAYYYYFTILHILNFILWLEKKSSYTVDGGVLRLGLLGKSMCPWYKTFFFVADA